MKICRYMVQKAVERLPLLCMQLLKCRLCFLILKLQYKTSIICIKHL
jgi:hypothetical protein